MDIKTELLEYLQSIKGYIISDKKSAIGFRSLVIEVADFILGSDKIPENEKKIIGEGLKNEINIAPGLLIGDTDDLSNITRDTLNEFKYFRAKALLEALIRRLGNGIEA